MTCRLLATLFSYYSLLDTLLNAAMDTPWIALKTAVMQPLQNKMPLSGQDTLLPFVTSSTSSTGGHLITSEDLRA